MVNKINFNGRSTMEDTSKFSAKEIGKQVREVIVSNFKIILQSSASTGYQWCGTMTDLMELTHIAWLSGDFRLGDGRQMQFCQMTVKVCRVLHCNVSNNPYNLVRKAAIRKGVKSTSVMERYIILTSKGLKNPMLLDIKFR